VSAATHLANPLVQQCSMYWAQARKQEHLHEIQTLVEALPAAGKRVCLWVPIYDVLVLLVWLLQMMGHWSAQLSSAQLACSPCLFCKEVYPA